MLPSIWWPGSPRGLSPIERECGYKEVWCALGVLPYRERVWLQGGLVCPRGFSPIEIECGYKEAWCALGGSPL